MLLSAAIPLVTVECMLSQQWELWIRTLYLSGPLQVAYLGLVSLPRGHRLTQYVGISLILVQMT